MAKNNRTEPAFTASSTWWGEQGFLGRRSQSRRRDPAQSIRDLRIAEVTQMDLDGGNGSGLGVPDNGGGGVRALLQIRKNSFGPDSRFPAVAQSLRLREGATAISSV